jgi:hypothetical protein
MKYQTEDRIKDIHRLNVLNERLIYLEAKIKELKQERKAIKKRLGKEYDNFQESR